MKDDVLDLVMNRVIKALSPIGPELIEFLDFDECYKKRPLIHVLVVAANMDDIRPSTRSRICDDLIKRDVELARAYIFAWQLLTPTEYALIKHHRHKLQ